MSSGEKLIQEGLQVALQTLDEFADIDIVINDWSILDASTTNAPYIIIVNADEFESRQDVPTPETTWSIGLLLVVPFIDWKTSYDAIRDMRQIIIDKINSSTVRSAGGLEAVNIVEVHSGSPIVPIDNPYLLWEDIENALPDFVGQLVLLECEEY